MVQPPVPTQMCWAVHAAPPVPTGLQAPCWVGAATGPTGAGASWLQQDLWLFRDDQQFGRADESGTKLGNGLMCSAPA